MKFFWGRKKKTEAEAGDPEFPAPTPDPAAPPTPPTAPPTPPEPSVPAPTPDPAHPPGPAPTEVPPSHNPPAEIPPPQQSGGIFARMASGLKRSSSRLTDGMSAIFTKRKLDAETLEEFEDLLLAADLGANAAARMSERLSAERFDTQVTADEISAALAGMVADTLRPHERDLDLSGAAPQVVLFVGVNGSGKTTTIGKIAAKIVREGRTATLAAGDTFRAAAIDQLKVWGERTNCTVVARETGSDAAGLVFDAYATARENGSDVLLVDTAGRLQNKTELMDELRKIVRALKKCDETSPHHVLLVLDATVGQNAIGQVDAFREAAEVTGLVMTKLDGTAKGGVLVAIAEKHADLPIYFTGMGESVDDLEPFSAQAFAEALAGSRTEAVADVN